MHLCLGKIIRREHIQEMVFYLVNLVIQATCKAHALEDMETELPLNLFVKRCTQVNAITHS